MRIHLHALNPNKRLSFKYGNGAPASISMGDTGSMLCSGVVPGFNQGTKNKTKVDIRMQGTGVPVKGPMHTLIAGGLKGLPVTLRVAIDEPIRIRLGSAELPPITFAIRCMVTVD